MACKTGYTRVRQEMSADGAPAGRWQMRCPRCGEFARWDGGHICWTENARGFWMRPDGGQRQAVIRVLEDTGHPDIARVAVREGLNAARREIVERGGEALLSQIASQVYGPAPTCPTTAPRRPGGWERGSEELIARAQGVMVGIALGDALGYQVEFSRADDLFERHGLWGVHTPPMLRGDQMLYTDDTQMTVALARGLLRLHTDWHRAVAEEFVAWYDSPENTRAPGGTCLAGCRNLKMGMPWDRSGVCGSKGNGTVMRVAPVGVLFADDEEMLLRVAVDQARMTHGHPTAAVAAAAGACAVGLLTKDTPPREMIQAVYQFVEKRFHTDEAGEVLRALDGAARYSDPARNEYEAGEQLGSGWTAEEALGIALWAFLRSPGDYPAVIRRAVNFPGRGGSCDRDTVGAIAGALAGAWNGVRGIPPEWVRAVENRDLLLQLGAGLARHTMPETLKGVKWTPIR